MSSSNLTSCQIFYAGDGTAGSSLYINMVTIYSALESICSLFEKSVSKIKVSPLKIALKLKEKYLVFFNFRHTRKVDHTIFLENRVYNFRPKP